MVVDGRPWCHGNRVDAKGVARPAKCLTDLLGKYHLSDFRCTHAPPPSREGGREGGGTRDRASEQAGPEQAENLGVALESAETPPMLTRTLA